MKKLLLLRHGNALFPDSGMDDYDRPLSSRGKKEINNIAYKLLENKRIPDIIITSTAKRALSTADIVRNIIKISDNDINLQRETDALYSASISEYTDILRSQKKSISTILIIAHNPAISGFCSKITGKHIGMGTGNLCLLEMDIENWSEIKINIPILSSALLKP